MITKSPRLPLLLLITLNPILLDISGLSWEVEFCKSVRVPWKKIVTAKKYMYCYDNVVRWDDCAAEEAFHSAKRRYWEKINRLPCDTPLPDPNEYTDEIDWYPDIDPELISELNRAYFNIDDVGNMGESFKRRKKWVHGYGSKEMHVNTENGSNPWESSITQEVRVLKEVSREWGHCTQSVNSKTDENPWERNCLAVYDASKKNVWQGCTDESSRWEQERKESYQSLDVKNSFLNYRNDASYVGEKERTRVADRSSGWKQWHAGDREQKHLVRIGNSWQNSSASQNGASWGKGRSDRGIKSWDLHNSGVQYKMPLYSEYKEPWGGGNTLPSGCRKRERSFQRPPRYESSRFQGNSCGVVHQWQKENSYN